MAGAPLKKREISGNRLLEVAAHLFRERGYMATSVRDIADAAGMKSGSIYYHYPSKDAILEAVIDRAQTALIEAMTAAIEGLSPDVPFRQKLHAAIEAHLTTYHKFGDFSITSRMSLDMLPDDSRKLQIAKRAEYGALWRRLFEDAVKNGQVSSETDIIPVQMFILGALNWTSEWLDPKRRSLGRASEIFTDLLIEGIATKKLAA